MRIARKESHHMRPLGALDELPRDYREALAARNLHPLWPSLRTALPPRTPVPKTLPTCWRYAEVRPLLLRAGELTPIERAERRVLVLANPGHGLENMQASPAIYLGMQLILPGESAPLHRHTPNAVRIVVEGEGAYTGVDGERCRMERGDLILTPAGCWHEHGHEGREPVIWLDVLDLPLMIALEASYVEDGAGAAVPQRASRSEQRYAGAGLVPSPMFERSRDAHPLMRFPWSRTRASLERLHDDNPDCSAVQLAYVDPEAGRPCFPTLGFCALMLRPGETLRLPVRSPAAAFHVVEGSGGARIDAWESAWTQGDTFCAPCFAAIELANASPDAPAFLIVADEAPLHRALGLYEVRAVGRGGAP
jgi:gentisate 1,2-dioxygenase